MSTQRNRGAIQQESITEFEAIENEIN